MPFRLADIQKTVRSRGDGERYIHPKILDAAATEGQVDLALAYFQARLGRKRRDFESELLVRFFGEPKVARGLVTCLSSTYRWRTQSFAEVLTPRDLARLERRGIRGPSDLRLHLFDLVNKEANGFLPGERESGLQGMAQRLGISGSALEQLFTLDSEEDAVLVRVADVPEPGQVVAAYNFQAVHALIRHCSYVEISEHADASRQALVGACREYGVTVTDEDSVLRMHNRADAFGNVARWGQRIARALYCAASVAPVLLRNGRVRVQVGGRAAWYLFDRRTLSSLTGGTGTVHRGQPLPELADRWQRQRPVGGAGGWQLSSMPEPLLFAAGLVVAPYAMRRDERQVLIWPVASPADGAAAQALHVAGIPVLALRVGDSAAPLPEGVAAIDSEAAAMDIVAALNARWGGERADAGAQAFEGLLAELDVKGFLSETQVCEGLGCAGREELVARLHALDPERGVFVPDVGLCSPEFAESMRRGLRRRARPKPAA